jgi:hypothetical protein
VIPTFEVTLHSNEMISITKIVICLQFAFHFLVFRKQKGEYEDMSFSANTHHFSTAKHYICIQIITSEILTQH